MRRKLESLGVGWFNWVQGWRWSSDPHSEDAYDDVGNLLSIQAHILGVSAFASKNLYFSVMALTFWSRVLTGMF